jgi:hypothetical protein
LIASGATPSRSFVVKRYDAWRISPGVFFFFSAESEVAESTPESVSGLFRLFHMDGVEQPVNDW